MKAVSGGGCIEVFPPIASMSSLSADLRFCAERIRCAVGKYLLVALLFSTTARAAGGPVTIEKTAFRDHAAYRLTDGKTEAVIVPELSGRVMKYGFVGGRNWLWAGPMPARTGAWSNVGGDKCFIGPHPAWKLFSESLWPPPFPTWDGAAHQVQELEGGRLLTTGPLWEGFGAKVIREFSISAAGELIIDQRVEKSTQTPIAAAVWVVSQARPPEAIYIPLNPQSTYARGFHPIGSLPPAANLVRLSPTLLRVKPTTGNSYKLGADSPRPAIAAVAEGIAWVQRAERQVGDYPEGPEGAGFPVEFYNHGESGDAQYVELEMLSALRVLRPTESARLSVRWSLHRLAAGGQAEDGGEIEKLLTAPIPPEQK